MLTQSQVQKISRTLKADKKEILAVFNALGDAGRMNIFDLLIEHKGLCVTDIAQIIGVSVPAVSQQLKIMELSGLVERGREGQKACYCIARDNDLVGKVIRLINSVK